MTPKFLWNKFEILTEYCVQNGLTLCMDCHNLFDALLCYVEVNENESGLITCELVVADCVILDDGLKKKWLRLNHTQIRLPEDPRKMKLWPTKQVLQFRKEKFLEYSNQRHNETIELKFVCPKCNSKVKTSRGLLAHMKSKKCLGATPRR